MFAAGVDNSEPMRRPPVLLKGLPVVFAAGIEVVRFAGAVVSGTDDSPVPMVEVSLVETTDVGRLADGWLVPRDVVIFATLGVLEIPADGCPVPRGVVILGPR